MRSWYRSSLARGGLEGEFLPCSLQLLREIGGAREQDAESVLDKREADGGGEVRLPGSAWAEHQAVGALLEPSVAGCQRVHAGLGEGRHGGELEALEALARGQPCFVEVALLSAPVAFGEFVLGQGGEQAGGRPSFGVGTLGEGLPEAPDGGQPQGRQHRVELFRVDAGVGCRAHDAGSCSRLP